LAQEGTSIPDVRIPHYGSSASHSTLRHFLSSRTILCKLLKAQAVSANRRMSLMSAEVTRARPRRLEDLAPRKWLTLGLDGATDAAFVPCPMGPGASLLLLSKIGYSRKPVHLAPLFERFGNSRELRSRHRQCLSTDYSFRSATIGSTPAARRAGITDASTAANASSSVANTSMTGSHGFTPNS
jgi:hypothetical protein